MASTALARRRKGYEHELEIREHRLISDEPEESGGGDQGPSPTELLAGALASCTAITIEMYADRKDWELGDVEVVSEFTKGTADAPPKARVDIRIPVELTDEQREKILKIAHKCPVHRALLGSDVEIDDSLELIGA
ncbi:MAG TPA: OsmC family protein [Solirubrobacterales bacterium]|nr:OsmC family protein [Solirubrobacterales bacterium]